MENCLHQAWFGVFVAVFVQFFLLFKVFSFLRNASIFDCHVRVGLVVLWIFWGS